jgi:hypothetical protein
MQKMIRPTFALVLAASLSLVGCGRGGDEFRNALPSADALKINVPEGQGQALALGETSEFYEATYNTSRFINGTLGGVFVIMGAITLTEPTVEEENMRQWGPSEPEGLERKSYRFTVEKVEEGTFEYVLEARNRGEEAEEDFKPVWSGVAYPDPAGETVGSGELNLHLDADDDDCTAGAAVVTYDAQPDLRTVDIDFDGIDNTCDDEPASLQSYHYSEDAEGAGKFQFSIKGNIHPDEEQKPLEETLTIKSSWLATGEGRSDLILTSSEIEADIATHLPESTATDVRVTECWNDLFELTFTDTEPNELREVIREPLGDSADCVFASDYPEAVEQLPESM